MAPLRPGFVGPNGRVQGKLDKGDTPSCYMPGAGGARAGYGRVKISGANTAGVWLLVRV